MDNRQGADERLTTDSFIELFICALVVRGKHTISMRDHREESECLNMYALYEYARGQADLDGEKEYHRFMVRLRNHLSPGPIGSFDGFKHMLRQKTLTMVSTNLPFCDYYSLTIQAVTAKCYLEQASPRMRQLTEEAADAYLSVGVMH